MLRIAIPILLALSPAMALAQSDLSVPTDIPDDLPGAAEEAVDALSEAGSDRLLIKDLMGATVSGPGGDEVGTVANLVAIPGGRIVAAIIELDDAEDPIVIPFSVLKLAGLREDSGIELPAEISDLRDDSAVQELTDSVDTDD